VAKGGANVKKTIALALLLASVGACTVHPPGEREERQAAIAAGKAWARPFEKREMLPLAADATPAQMVEHALLHNAELEAKYWEWRSMLEQVPQDGTQKTGLELSFETMIMDGNSAWEDTVAAIGNDAMNSLMLPNKLGTMAAMALKEARAAGLRFDKAKFELRNQVLAAYYEYALSAELARLENNNTRLLEMMMQVAESRLATGTASQVDLLKSANAAELSRNESAMQTSRLSMSRAMLNALLNRPAEARLDVPSALPAAPRVVLDDATLLGRVARHNPELQALAQEVAGKKDAIERARQDYLPEFAINIGTDLAGVTQSVMGSVVLPYLRHEAIDAGVRQAVANLRAAEAMQRQTAHELAARVIADVSMLRDAQRQVELLDKTLLPRAEQIVTASQNAYATGVGGAGAAGGGMGGGMGGGAAGAAGGAAGGGLLDLLDSQRTLISLQRMRAELQVTWLKQVADLEEIAAQRLPE
jgi:outer membrane protein TolC